MSEASVVDKTLANVSSPVSKTNSNPSDLFSGDATSNEHEIAHVPFPGGHDVDLPKKSPGVKRAEAIASVITLWDRIFIFSGLFLIAYAYGLDGTVRYTYQIYAVSSFKEHSLQAAVNVLRQVIAAAAQPTAAKIADVFGRIELICLSVFFYLIGTIIQAAAKNVGTFSAGAVIYQIGYTMIIFLVEIIVGDITSTRSRVFFSYIPALPFIINTWISGNVTSTVLANTTWRWGIGMWCIIYFVCSLPLILSLWVVQRRAHKRGLISRWKDDIQLRMNWSFWRDLFWLLDVIGVILIIAVLALLLVPLTLAGGESEKWKQGYIIAPLVVGFACIPVFIIWELKAPHPLVPFSRMKSRKVWAPLGIACFLDFAWAIQGDYLYTTLMVSFNFGISGATRVTSLYSFASVITGPIVGLIIYKVRKIKIFIVLGVCIFMSAYGILYHYRSGHSKSGIIGGEVLLGIGGGMFPYPAQAVIQVFVEHEYFAIMTGLYLALYNIGSSLGYTVSGAIWTQVLDKQLHKHLDPINATLADATYAAPLTVILEYPYGTPTRQAIIDAYSHVQRLLVITGMSLVVPLLVFALLLPNPTLNNKQSLVADDGTSQSDSSSDKDGEGNFTEKPIMSPEQEFTNAAPNATGWRKWLNYIL